MSLPASPYPLVTELLVDDSWRDVTDDSRAVMTIARGRANESGRGGPSHCNLTLNNRTGRYSNRNPLSPYFGLLGRNTPLRVRMADPALYPTPTYRSVSTAEFTGETAAVSAPAGVAAGDILVAFQSADSGSIGLGFMDTPAGDDAWQLLVSKQTVTAVGLCTRVWWKRSIGAEPASYLFTQSPAAEGVVTIVAIANGGSARPLARLSFEEPPGAGFGTPTTVPPGVAGLELRWAAASDVTGVGGVSWTPPAGFTERSDLQFGTFTTGTLATRVLATGDPTGVHTFTLSSAAFDEGHGVTVNVMADTVRFHGEVASWPPRWEAGAVDVRVPIEASGVLRRLGAGSGTKPLKSPLHRATAALTPSAHWPLDDANGATQGASAVNTALPMSGDARGFGAAGALGATSMLDLAAGGQLVGPVPPSPGVTAYLLTAVLIFPEGLGSATAETPVRWAPTGGSLVALDFDATSTIGSVHWFTTSSSGTIATQAVYDGKPHHWVLYVQESAGDILLTIAIDGTYGPATNIGAGTIGYPSAAGVGLFLRTLANQATVGHLAVWTGAAADYAFTQTGVLRRAMEGYVGERAGERMARLCAEEGVDFEFAGNPDATAALGPQRAGAILDLLREAEAADTGILFEPRSRFGLAYRTRASMYNQTPLALDYATKHLHGSLHPQDDDQLLANDVTVTRLGGSSGRSVLDTGPLSTQDPPDGVGTYDRAITLNVETDAQLLGAASWLRHLGTWDEARYPLVSAWLHSPVYRANPVLAAAAAALEIGDRFTIAHPPAFLPPGPIDLLAQGVVEVLDAYRWELSVNATPGGPWRVFELAEDTGDTGAFLGYLVPESFVLAEALDLTETGVDITTTPLWSTTADDWTPAVPVVFDGEVMLVTGVSGGSNPQTLTVIRGANGILKTHSAGAAGEFLSPGVLGR